MNRNVLYLLFNNQKNKNMSIKKVEALGVFNIENRIRMRKTPLKEWLNTPELSDRLSGTLKKNHRIGFKVLTQLREEAIAQTIGWGFESIPSTYTTIGDAVSFGDTHELTEAGWHTDRFLHLNPFEEDKYELQFLNIQDEEGNLLRQGVAIIMTQTSIVWLPESHRVFAMLTEYDPIKGEWSECVNPF